MVLAAGGRLIGPGHFGRVIIEEGVEKMSCHYEADLDQGGPQRTGNKVIAVERRVACCRRYFSGMEHTKLSP